MEYEKIFSHLEELCLCKAVNSMDSSKFLLKEGQNIMSAMEDGKAQAYKEIAEIIESWKERIF